jgi:hypothetical protein
MSIRIINWLVCINLLLKIMLTNSFGLNNLECTIQNSKFSNEYLFKDNSNEKDIENNYDTTLKPNVYLYPLNRIYDLEVVVWKFIRVDSNNSNIYFIKAESNDEFLCASNRINHLSQIKHRFLPMKERFVYTTLKTTKSMVNNNMNDCKWKLTLLKSENNSISNNIGYFNIWNMNGNNCLYVSSSLFHSGKYKRNVYLWFKPSSSDSFKWKIDCSLNIFNNIILNRLY